MELVQRTGNERFFTPFSRRVILRSVETTGMSLTVLMNRLLPALNGPVTTILRMRDMLSSHDLKSTKR